MRILSTVVVAVALVAGLPGAVARPAAAITGVGPSSITATPWHVLLTVRDHGRDRIFCGGTVIDPRYVVTAAHCVGGSPSRPRPKATLAVHAGIASFPDRRRLTAWQRVRVARIHIHPWFEGRLRDVSPFAQLRDDVAVLELARPLRLDGRTVAAALVGAAGTGVRGKVLTVSGFGLQSDSGRIDGRLRRLAVRVGRLAPGERRYDALWMSGRSRRGALCAGDSGGGLIERSFSGPVLVGVVSLADGCRRGEHAFFVDFAAAEQRVFVEQAVRRTIDRSRLVRAPVGGQHVSIAPLMRGAGLRPGRTVRCRPGGDWAGKPHFTYRFIVADRRGRQHVRQVGISMRYVIAARDRGHRLGCRVGARTDGGSTLTGPVMTRRRVAGRAA